MNSFIKTNKTLFTYLLIFLIVIPIFGINFFMSFIGNILLLLFLVPLLILLVLFISFNSIKTKINRCSQCGTISLGKNDICVNCGSVLEDIDMHQNKININPGERTIEVEAEEID